MAAIERDGAAWLWNPDGMDVADALVRAAPGGGTVVVAGGGRTMALMLPYLDAFDLAVATACTLPDGRPCVEGADTRGALAERIAAAGLVELRSERLDRERRVRLHRHVRPGSAPDAPAL